MMLMGRYFLSPRWLPGLGTPWHLCVEYQECCTGECPQKDHLAGGTKVVGEGRGCKKKKLFKASCSQGQTGLCSCSGNAGWTRQAMACFYCVRAAGSTVPCGGRLGNFKSTIAGAPFADPAACCPTFKDGLHLKAAGELLLFNLLQYM